MKINQYNFIIGEVGSGKSVATLKLIKHLKNRAIYFDLEGGVHRKLVSGFLKNGLLFSLTSESSYKTILDKIILLNEDCFERLDIIIDPVTFSNDDLYNLIQDLPKNHRYFFVLQAERNPFDINQIRQYAGDKMKYISSELNLDYKKISMFVAHNLKHGKMDDSISLYNYNTNESCNLGGLSQIVRDIKLNEILNDES